MISRILQEVKSPFTDELIVYLIKTYIACNCNDDLFYKKINHLYNDDNKVSYSTHTQKLINQIYSQGIPKNELYRLDDRDKISLLYDNYSSRSWLFLSSDDDPMKYNTRSINEIFLVYRIYLNLKGKEKAEFIQNYIKRFQELKIPFELKFSLDDTRLDQVIILSPSENLEKNVLAVEELTKEFDLGKLPMLIGEYKNGIGIAEEYHNTVYSPTMAKLVIVRSAVKKYLCDHINEFESQLSDKEKAEINMYIDLFEFDINFYNNGADKRYSQEKNPIDCAKEHIENLEEATYGRDLQVLANAIKQIYLNNPEQFISEISQNYRMIGTQVWGFAQDFVFSNETERTFLNSKENGIPLSSEQIGSELAEISREGLTYGVQVDLNQMVEKNGTEKEK